MSWKNVVDDCPLCEMENKTHRYYEDDWVVIADALGTGRPFVVLKYHTDDVAQHTYAMVSQKVREVFGDHELAVRMGKIPDHWHAHIIDPGTDPTELRDE